MILTMTKEIRVTSIQEETGLKTYTLEKKVSFFVFRFWVKLAISQDLPFIVKLKSSLFSIDNRI